jgi:membrane protease YdiL (CAAX protease family)
MEAPPIPARIWVETFAIFLFGFLLLKLVATLVAALAPGAAWPEWFHLVAQWALAPLILWPAVRARSWDRVRFEIGWHRGRGVAREVLAGIGGYLAMLPVLVAVAIIAMIINNLLGNQSTPTRDNPVLSRATGGFVELLLLGTLVAIWAPLVEESLFRGVVFRFFRRRWGILAGAAGSALLFAGLHSYVLQGLVIVGTLGFSFALVREWRGSLIPSMTAHCLHNSVAFILITIIAHIARG